MAENRDDSQERSELPTEKRKREGREKGQVLRSKELDTFFLLIGATSAVFLFGEHMAVQLSTIFTENFQVAIEEFQSNDFIWMKLRASVEAAFYAFLPFGLFMGVMSILSPIIIGGGTFNLTLLQPKPERMNPISGLKRMVSVKSLMELLKGILKVTLVSGFALCVLWYFKSEISSLLFEPVLSGATHSVKILSYSFLFISAAMIVVAAIDVPFQIWQHQKSLKMTMQEVKDEFKETEGKPEVKAKIRQLQQQVANKRMLDSVPDADVIITNPTHFAVALKYKQGDMSAPVVVAKGLDFLALKIREVGQHHHISIIELPPLARALYYSTEVEDEIPEGLYVAIAKVLTYVYQLKNYQKGEGEKPNPLQEVDIPDDLKR